jgi:CheY-like chemotaxis protein
MQASESTVRALPPSGAGATILLVEDEASVRSTVRRLLERHEYRVLEATNGQDALALIIARHGEVDLILSDMVMPGMGGAELATRVRAFAPTLPVLLMTGYTEEALARNGDRPLDQEIIEKPFTLHIVLEKVRTALARKTG